MKLLITNNIVNSILEKLRSFNLDILPKGFNNF